MKHLRSSVAATIGLCFSIMLLGLPGAASAASPHKKPPPPTPAPPPPASSMYVKAFSASVNGAQLDLAPEQLQPTSDGGYIVLATAESAAGAGVSLLVKLDSVGAPQWQEVLGCSRSAPGDYSEGVSLQQTADGGYIIGGGTIDCGSGTSCPAVSGRQCALVVKLDPAGDVTWARVYDAEVSGSVNQIQQTADGGYVAVGSALDSQHNVGAMIIKLDNSGNVQWQRELAPAGSDGAYFNSVTQSPEGGYVATGDFYTATSGPSQTQVLVAGFSADGSIGFKRDFAAFGTGGTNGTPTSVSDATSVISTSDGGYAVTGTWSDATFNSNAGAHGGLLLKLDSSGNLQWQRAYSGGQYCFNGVSESPTCTNIGAVSYSVHQTSDGGYILAGDGDLELTDETPLVPWQAKVDANGNLVWQQFNYQTAPTGRPLSSYFGSSALAPNEGSVAEGVTENPTTLKNELYLASTDSAGQVASCADIHPATPLQAVIPGFVAVTVTLPVQSVTTTPASSAIVPAPTSITTQSDC